MEQVVIFTDLSVGGLKRLGRPVIALLSHLYDHFLPHHRNNYHPHVFGHRAMAMFSAALLLLKVFTISVTAFGPVMPAFSSAITAENIISLTNASRNAYKLGFLTENELLTKAAQNKAEDMLKKEYFSHNSPDGKTPWSFIQNSGYNYLMAGENLAVNFSEAESVEEAWMNSPGHKANILNKNFEEIGIGIAQGEYQGHTAIFVVQMFGTPIEQKVTITDIPTSLGNSQEAALGRDGGQLSITDVKADVEEGKVRITAKVEPAAAKVIAYYGKGAIMLSPKPGERWEGYVPLGSLAKAESSVKVKAYDIQGRSRQVQLADFASNTVDNYNVLGASTELKVKWFGRVFNPNQMEEHIYLIFITGMLTSLVLAIGIHRHIQHLSLVANGSFVVILAALLLTIG